jgi:hypothetical protein
VSNDPLHPYIPNGTGKQPTYRITDLTNPNLKPWAKEQMKKDNDDAPRQDRIHAARATSRCGVSTSVCRTRYGESIGHYEGDALVVDTIGTNSRIRGCIVRGRLPLIHGEDVAVRSPKNCSVFFRCRWLASRKSRP